MDAEEARVEAVAAFHGDIEDAALKGELGIAEFVGEGGLRIPRGDGEAGEKAKAAGVIAAVRHLGERQIESGGLQACLEVGEVIRGADFTHAEGIGTDGGEDLDDAGFFSVRFGRGGGGLLLFRVKAVHREPVLHVVGAKREAIGIGSGLLRDRECRGGKKNGGQQGPPRDGCECHEMWEAIKRPHWPPADAFPAAG